MKDQPGITKKKFLYNLSRASYQKDWGQQYQPPTFGERFVAFLVRILPKFGPLKVLQLRTPTPETERIFLVTGTFVASSAMYLGLHPRTGGIFMGIGLSLNELFWLAEAAMIYYAIRLRNIPRHKEWMIRTYILACNGIVGDRILANIPILVRRIGIAAVNDLSGWLLWTAPLMIAEVIIQLRRLRKTRHRPTRETLPA